MLALKINAELHTVDAPPDMPLVWVLGNLLGFNGTNFSCGGACTVHLNGEATPQYEYCQLKIMSVAVLLRENPDPSDAEIDDAMSGNICRCGTYQRLDAIRS